MIKGSKLPIDISSDAETNDIIERDFAIEDVPSNVRWKSRRNQTQEELLLNLGRLTIDVLGVKVDATNLDDACGRIFAWIKNKTRSYVCVTGVHGIMEAQRQPDLKQVHNMAGMVTPDGMPLVYIARADGNGDCGRVYGPDLMLAVCDRGIENKTRHFFYGTTPETLARLVANMSARFPGIEIAGSYSPPFRVLTDAERDEIADTINHSGADIVWVGLSTPKQERWMAENRSRLNAAVLIGVGAAFDFHAGTVRQAPRWMQPLCLEWLFRLAMEPKRLWRRYLGNNPRFVLSFVLQRMKLKAF